MGQAGVTVLASQCWGLTEVRLGRGEGERVEGEIALSLNTGRQTGWEEGEGRREGEAAGREGGPGHQPKPVRHSPWGQEREAPVGSGGSGMWGGAWWRWVTGSIRLPVKHVGEEYGVS